MKKTKKSVAVFLLLTMIMTIIPSVQAKALSYDKTAAVLKADSITIDGQLSDSAWFDMQELSNLYVGDMQEINAIFGVTWDNDNFYIGVSVDAAIEDKTDFSSDSITFYFAPDNYRGTPYSSDDFQVQIFNQGTCVTAGAAGVGKNDSLDVSAITVAYAAQENGYSIEIAMPWSVVGTIPHDDSNVMGFDIMAFSNGEDCVMEWSGGTWINTTNNGTLTFTCDGTETASTIEPLEETFATGSSLYFDYTCLEADDYINIYSADDTTYETPLRQQQMTLDDDLQSGEIAFADALTDGNYMVAVVREGSVVVSVNFKIAALDILTDKIIYTIGEDTDITVTYNNTTSSTDWIGIYRGSVTPSSGSPSILWSYVSVTSTAETYTFTEAISSLSAGSYKSCATAK